MTRNGHFPHPAETDPYVICICLWTNKYQKYKSIEFGDQQCQCVYWNFVVASSVTCEIHLFISWCQRQFVVCGAGSSLGRLHRHLYSPVPTHFAPDTTFLANASIPSIRSTLPSYYSTLYPLPWDSLYTSAFCLFICSNSKVIAF